MLLALAVQEDASSPVSDDELLEPEPSGAAFDDDPDDVPPPALPELALELDPPLDGFSYAAALGGVPVSLPHALSTANTQTIPNCVARDEPTRFKKCTRSTLRRSSLAGAAKNWRCRSWRIREPCPSSIGRQAGSDGQAQQRARPTMPSESASTPCSVRAARFPGTPESSATRGSVPRRSSGRCCRPRGCRRGRRHSCRCRSEGAT